MLVAITFKTICHHLQVNFRLSVVHNVFLLTQLIIYTHFSDLEMGLFKLGTGESYSVAPSESYSVAPKDSYPAAPPHQSIQWLPKKATQWLPKKVFSGSQRKY